MPCRLLRGTTAWSQNLAADALMTVIEIASTASMGISFNRLRKFGREMSFCSLWRAAASPHDRKDHCLVQLIHCEPSVITRDQYGGSTNQLQGGDQF